MKITIQIVLETNEHDGKDPIVEEIFSFQRNEDNDILAPENLGLSLAEAKSLLAGVQKKLINQYTSDELPLPQE